MQGAKENVLELLKKLPDDASYEDIMYEIELQRKINEGISEIERGNYLTHEEAMERLKRWLK
ncbi:MAG: hypothetical protein ACFFCS_23550 [Candidatus Hodarchaeota archaeon]